MLLLTQTRSRGAFACITLMLAFTFALVLAQRADAAYQVPNFKVTAAPTQAAAHPKLTVSIDPNAYNADTTGGDDLRDLTITAPAGLQLNMAAATTKCTDAQLPAGTCPGASRVGTLSVKWRTPVGTTVTLAGNAHVMTTPTAGNTASLGFLLKANGYKNMALRANVSNAIPVSQPTQITVSNVTRTITNSLGLTFNATVDQIDVVLNAKANASANGPYFTLNPSTCGVNTTKATLASWGNVVIDKTSAYTTTNCPGVPFQPTATVAPTVSNLNAPTGLNTSFTVPAGELATQSSLVKSINVATPTGVLLSMPNVSSVTPCSEANLLADTCPLSAKIGTTSFTFWGSSAASGDLYKGASSANGFEVGAVSRGANGVVSISRGKVEEYDSNGDTVADRVRLVLDRLPGATWSAASFNITSTLLQNSCPTGSSTTTIQGASASTVVRTGTWLIGICQPAPETTISGGPSGITNIAAPQFTFTSSIAASTFECQMDGSTFAPCASPYISPSLANGWHTFCVRAISNGMTDPSPACQTFNVDTVAPTVNIASPGPSVSFVTEAGATATCSLNSSAAVSCSSPWTITPPSGGYSLTICATDAAGNTGCSTLIVDPPPFSVTITAAPPSSTSSSTAFFGFESSTAGVTFECSFDAAAFAACASPATYTALAFGSHTFCVRGRDAVGNLSSNTACSTFTYELPPPPMQLIRTAPATSPSNSTTASFTVTNVPAGNTLMGSLDGGPEAAFTNPKVFTGLTDGAHTFTVYAVDGSGFLSPAISNTWVVDTIAPPVPTLVRVSPVSSPSSSTTAQFTFTDTESPVTFQVSIDGSAYTTATSPRFLTGLVDGAHTFAVRAVDQAGNISPSAFNTWISGGPPPPPPTVIGPSGLVSSTSASITFTGTQAGLTYECQQDGSAWSTCTSPRLITGLTQGSHTFCVRARDSEGNIGGSTCITWTVDTIPPAAPQVFLTSPTSSPTTQTTATIVITPAEPGGTLQGSLDGAAFAPVTSPVNLTGLAMGNHTYSARQVDAAGNISSMAYSSWSITTGPVVPTITSGPNNPTASTSASFTFSGAPIGAAYQCQLDGGAWTACVSPATFAGMSEGAHTFCVRIVDGGGNISSPACRTWTVDTTPPAAPTVTLVSPGASPTNQTTATISWVGAESGGSFQRSIDGGAFGTTLSPLNLTNLSDGCHTVSVRQVDLAGNIGSTSSVSWCVGGVPPLSPPTLTRTSPADSPASQSTASFDVSDVAAGATIQGSLDGAPFAAMTSPISFTNLAEGAHTFTVRLIDAAGTTSPNVSDSWFVDTVAPAAPPVALSSPVSSPTTQTSATIAIGMTESGVTLQGALDGAAYATVGSYVNLTGLALGTHTYSARQVDPAGNSSSVATIVWTIIAPTSDTVAPSIDGLSSSLGAGGATITYSASDDSGATPTCTPASGTTFPFRLTAGLLITVSCLDGSGNMNTTSLNVTSNGPAMGLVTTLTGGPSGTTTSPAPTFTYSVNRATSGTQPCSPGQTCAAVTVPLIEFNCTLDGSAVACAEGSYTTPTLPLGAHTFCVSSRGIYSGEASAPSCSTFTVTSPGATSPDVAVTSPAFYGATGASPINVAYTVNGSTTIPAGTTCSVDGVPSTTPTTNAAVLDLGTNAIPVTCANASGSDTEYVVMARYSGYGVAITTPAPNSTHSSASVNVTYNRWSYGASGTCTINGIASTSGSVNDVALPLGTSSIDLVCPWGNSVTKSSISVTRGNAPAVAITAPADNSSAGSSTNLSYTVDGLVSPPAGTTCRVNGVLSTGGTTNLVALAAGANLVTVSCSNIYGFSTSTITVNNTIPTNIPVITAGPTGTVGSTSATFTFTGVLIGGTYDCQLDGGVWSGCSSPRSITGLSQGAHTFCVRLVDSAGNPGPPVCQTWTVDTVPPPPPTVSGPSSPSAQTTATITFSNSEAGVTCEGSLDGAAFATAVSPTTLTGLTSGAHTYAVRCRDAVGNVGSATTYVWETGGDPLPIAISSGPTGTVSSTVATFEFTSGITAGTTYECQLDGGPFAPCTSPTNYSNLTQGSHTFCVRATNGATTSSPACRSWTVDTVGPTVTITSPSGPTGAFPLVGNFTIADLSPITSTTCARDNGTAVSCASPYTLPATTSGVHTFKVCATDSASNTTCATSSFDYESPMPIVTITSGPSGTVASTSASFTFSSDLTPVTFSCNLDGSAFSSCTSPKSYVSLVPGSHTFCVRGTTAVGDVGPSACRSWTVATGNLVTITSGPAEGSVVTASTATFTYAAAQQTSGTPCPVGQTCVQVIVDITPYYCSFDGGAYQFCGVTSPTFPRFTTPTLITGAHTFCVRASGVAGIDPQTHNAIPNGVYGPSTCRTFTKTT